MAGMPPASPLIAETDRSDERPESTPFGSQAPCPAESAGRRSLRVRGRRNRRSLTESERMAEDAARMSDRKSPPSGEVSPVPVGVLAIGFHRLPDHHDVLFAPTGAVEGMLN